MSDSMIAQIYEIQDPQEAEKCVELGVDRIGSVLLSKDAWQAQSIKDVCLLTRGTATMNSIIPLFPDEDILYRALDYYQPQFVHFCETLTDDIGGEIDLDPFIQIQVRIKKRFPEIGIMRSIPIPRNGKSHGFPTLKIARALAPVSDLFLTDTWLGKEPVEGYIGITGMTVDWDMAKDLVDQSEIPVILAGGISPDNVYEALGKTVPAGADSCTLTNMMDGNGRPIRFKKDFRKVEKFVNEVRRAKAAIC